MNLTSYERVRRFISASGADSITDTVNNKRDIMQWIPSISAQVEKYLNKKLHIEERTQYYEVSSYKRDFYVEANPIITITSVYISYNSLWDGQESEVLNNILNPFKTGVCLSTYQGLSYPLPCGLRIIYTGGVAYDGVNSVYNCTPTGSFVVGNFVIGRTSGAVGICRAITSSTITIEVLYGGYTIGEIIEAWDTETSKGSSTATATLDSASQLALCESYPDIVTATEMQIRYMWKNKHTFEDAGVNKDGQTQRRIIGSSNAYVDLQPEVKGILNPHRRISL